ncbi:MULTISPECIES: hypothetical protein [Chelativorans]|jgi:hypothetical protein|uniref:Uncharacterized protein n=1 Tax=Chelativorans sp. (strain BNC1) TaxID=266779 RepID=Q11DY6_CHESB|nr:MULTISPECIES: hypothetical protein [Chelativorans]
MSSTFDLVQAVEQKKQVTCTYQGYHRELCVHVVGWKNGREQALALQFAGESSSGLQPGGSWRCLVLDEVSNVSLRDGPWHTRNDHSQPQTCVDHKAAEVAY